MELYIVPVPQGDNETFLIFRPLLGLAFLGNRGLADLALQLAHDPDMPLREDIFCFLQASGFFQPDPQVPLPPEGRFNPQGVTLLLTNQCQLRCTYCYAAAGESTRQVLPLEYGKLAIDYVARSAQTREVQRFDLSFHGGGEPTLAWTTIQALTDYARQKPLPASISLTSNGIWSKRETDWILANIDGVSISMDGGAMTQNLQRPFASGKPSFKWVMRSLSALESKSFAYTIRMTAQSPWDSLAQDVAFLCENTRCFNIQVEPAFNTKRGEECSPPGDEGQKFVKAFLEAYQVAKQSGRRLIYSGSNPENVSAAFCSAGYSSLIVTPDGSLVACYTTTSSSHPLAPLTTVGRIQNGEIQIDESSRSRLHQLISERRQACRGCWSYWSCAGDCFAKYLVPQHGGHLVFDGRCDVNRHLLRELILDQMANSGTVWKRQCQVDQQRPYPPDENGPLA